MSFGKDTPDTPDVVGAAREEGVIGQQNLRNQTYANRPNQYTPWGSIEWTSTPLGGAAPEVATPAPGAPAVPATGTPNGGGAYYYSGGSYTGEKALPGTRGYSANQSGAPSAAPYSQGGAIQPQAQGGQFPTEKWEQRVTLNPELQAALDSQLRLQNERSGLAEGMLSRVQKDFAEPIDWEQFGDYENAPDTPEDTSMQARNRAEAAINARQRASMDPRYASELAQMQSRLAAQGLTEDMPAYRQRMEDWRRSRDDAYENARMRSIAAGGQEASREINNATNIWNRDAKRVEMDNNIRQAQIADVLRQRGSSLNELNAVLNGQQVQNPSFQPFKGAGVAPTPDITGAQETEYGMDLNSTNAGNAGWDNLFSLGTAAAGGGMFNNMFDSIF